MTFVENLCSWIVFCVD